MPVDFTGYWKMLANENFEEYLRALDVNVALRKIANLLKPDKEIVQDGDHMIIRTLSTFRNYIMDFQVGKEFEEDLTGIDDRKCMVRIRGVSYRGGGALTKGWASSSEREQGPLCSKGLKTLPTPSPHGGQHRLMKHPALSTLEGDGYEGCHVLCLHCVQALCRVLHAHDFT
uniref:Cytosolic fatty-acid binding proteins domain-containing protein n=1 Tax=Callithrix jacchus TaxID=9483 RepID=A0A2R8NA85_CALJA